MDGSDATAAGVDRNLLRQLQRLEETQGWAHHVGDLDRGELTTTALDRPLGSLARAARLEQLGLRFDPSILGPTYVLTPQRPFLPAPEVWIRVFGAVLYASHSGGLISWAGPTDASSTFDVGSLHAFFAGLPQGRPLMTLSVSAGVRLGGTGHLLIASSVSTSTVTVPVDGSFTAHTIDLRLTVGDAPAEVFLFVRGRISAMFRALAISYIPVLEPAQPS